MQSRLNENANHWERGHPRPQFFFDVHEFEEIAGGGARAPSEEVIVHYLA